MTGSSDAAATLQGTIAASRQDTMVGAGTAAWHCFNHKNHL
jgi:hypothetical protein